MDASAKLVRSRKAFTLVELLTVIVIIGILASMITAAAISARRAAKEAAIRTEISQLEIAVVEYETEHQQFPPDFFMLSSNADSRAEVVRHIRRRFPKYDYSGKGNIWDQFVYDMSQNYGVDVLKLDPASALVFWLGGLPEQPGGAWRPEGFHADPRHPFKPGKPRIKPCYEFASENDRLQVQDANGGLFRYYGGNLLGAPFVYFKSRAASTGRSEYGWVSGNSFYPSYYKHLSDPENVAVAYLDGDDADKASGAIYNQETAANAVRPWRSPKKFQIQHPGLDEKYGDESMQFRYTRTGRGFSSNQRDHSNILSGAGSTLGDEL